jgi:hypothetical protein
MIATSPTQQKLKNNKLKIPYTPDTRSSLLLIWLKLLMYNCQFGYITKLKKKKKKPTPMTP